MNLAKFKLEFISLKADKAGGKYLFIITVIYFFVDCLKYIIYFIGSGQKSGAFGGGTEYSNIHCWFWAVGTRRGSGMLLQVGGSRGHPSKKIGIES